MLTIFYFHLFSFFIVFSFLILTTIILYTFTVYKSREMLWNFYFHFFIKFSIALKTYNTIIAQKPQLVKRLNSENVFILLPLFIIMKTFSFFSPVKTLTSPLMKTLSWKRLHWPLLLLIPWKRLHWLLLSLTLWKRFHPLLLLLLKMKTFSFFSPLSRRAIFT